MNYFRTCSPVGLAMAITGIFWLILRLGPLDEQWLPLLALFFFLLYSLSGYRGLYLLLGLLTMALATALVLPRLIPFSPLGQAPTILGLMGAPFLLFFFLHRAFSPNYRGVLWPLLTAGSLTLLGVILHFLEGGRIPPPYLDYVDLVWPLLLILWGFLYLSLSGTRNRG